MNISLRSVKCVYEHSVLLISLYLESAIRRCPSVKYILDLYWDIVSRSIQYFAAEHGKQNGGYLLQKQQQFSLTFDASLNFFFNIQILSSTIHSTHIQLCCLMLYCQISYSTIPFKFLYHQAARSKSARTSWP